MAEQKVVTLEVKTKNQSGITKFFSDLKNNIQGVKNETGDLNQKLDDVSKKSSAFDAIKRGLWN